MVCHTGHPIVAFFSSFQSRNCKSLFTSLSSLLSTHLHMPRPCLPHRRFLLQRRHSKTFVDWTYKFSAFMDTFIAYYLKILHIDFWFYHHLLENCLVQCDGYFALPLCYSNCTYIFFRRLSEVTMSQPVTWVFIFFIGSKVVWTRLRSFQPWELWHMELCPAWRYRTSFDCSTEISSFKQTTLIKSLVKKF